VWSILGLLESLPAIFHEIGPRQHPRTSAKSFWRGVFPQVFNSDAWNFHQEIAEKYGPIIKIKAVLGENQLYVFDPKAMHHIIVKDQYVYEETSAFIEGNKLAFGPGLIGTLGEQHRKQRKMLNPVFSIVHMREMVPTFYNVTYKLRDTFAKKVKNGPQEIDLLFWMSRTALELVGQSGLGYSFDPLTEDGELHPYSKSVINASFLQALLRPLLYLANACQDWLSQVPTICHKPPSVEVPP